MTSNTKENTTIEENAQLQQFLALANGARGKAAEALVLAALQQPLLFVFGELMEHPNIKALENGPYGKLLRLFAYGTYSEYKQCKDELPELDKKHVDKLKKLTIVSMCESSKTISYDVLMRHLDIDSIRELEDIIIDCIYAKLIEGRLNQKSMVLDVEYSIGRDIGPGDVGKMINKLVAWQTKLVSIDNVLSDAGRDLNEAYGQRMRSDEEMLAHKKKKEKRGKPKLNVNTNQDDIYQRAMFNM